MDAGETVVASSLIRDGLNPLQWWQKFRGNEHSDAARLAWNPAYPAMPLQGENHRVHAGRRNLEEALHVYFCRRAAIHQTEMVNEGQELPLALGVTGCRWGHRESVSYFNFRIDFDAGSIVENRMAKGSKRPE